MATSDPGRLDLGEVTVPGGYFLATGVRRRPFRAEPRASSGGYRHVHTYGGGPSTVKEAAIELIDGARTKVFVASFRIGDKDLLAALYRAAERLRGGVYVITEIGERSLTRGVREVSEMEAVEDDLEAQNKRFPELTSRGIWVRGHENCHAKFLVVDDAAALVSSANLEERALRVTGENGVVVRAPAEVGRLARFFTRLWFTGCTWEVPPGPRESYQAGRRTPLPAPCAVPKPDPRRNGVIWTHDDEQHIHRALIDVMNLARHDLLLASFSLVKLADHPGMLTGPLAAAIGRGVRARALVRPRGHIREHQECARLLKEMGVEVYGDTRTHAKGVIADRRHGALFSANFDADHGIYSGVETGVRLDGENALADAADFFEHGMLNADRIMVLDPPQHRMGAALGALRQARWSLGEDVAVAAEDRTWRALCTAAATGPVLFRPGPDGPVLLAGTGRWRLGARVRDGVHRLTREDSGTPGPAAGRLLEDWLSASEEKWQDTLGFAGGTLHRTRG